MADAFRYLAMSWCVAPAPAPPAKAEPAAGFRRATLNELWHQATRRPTRL